jgi:uncharacterized protein YegP (UPF0339 family)
MAAKYHLKRASDGQFHFSLHASNGEIVLSSELYKAKASARDGIESVRQNAHRDGAFELKVAVNGKHYCAQGQQRPVIGQSQMYANRANEGGGGGEALRQRRRNQRRLLNAASRRAMRWHGQTTPGYIQDSATVIARFATRGFQCLHSSFPSSVS